MSVPLPKDPHRRIWVSLFLLLVLIIVAGGTAYYRQERASFSEDRYRVLAAIAEFKAQEISHWYADRLGDIRRITINPFLGPHLAAWLDDPATEPGFPDEARALLESERLVEGCRTVRLLSPEGRTLVEAGSAPADLDEGERLILQTVVRTGEPALNFYRRGPEQVQVDVMAPVKDPQGRLLAILEVENDAESFIYPLIRTWPTPSATAETLLVRLEGDDVLFLNNLRHRAHTALTLRQPLTAVDLPAVQAVQGTQGVFEGVDYRGKPVLADLRPVPDTPWFMVAKVDQAEIFAEARVHVLVISLVGGLLILLAGATAAYLSRRQRTALVAELLTAERRERAALEEFRATLYSIGDGVVTTDSAGRVKQMNPVAERLTGWAESEAAGRPLPEVFHIVNEETRAPAANPVERVLAEGGVVGLANHTLLIARDGVERPIADSAAPILGPDGSVAGTVLVFQDQTDLHARLGAVQASEARLRSIVEGSPLGSHSYALHPDGRLVFEGANPAAERILGIDHEPLVGLTIEEAFPALRDTGFPQAYRKVAHDGGVFREEIVYADDRGINGAFDVVAFQTAVNRMTAFFQDTTERVKLQRKLQEANQRLETTLSALPDLLFEVDAEGTFLSYRAPDASKLYVKPEAFLGRRVDEVLPPNAASEILGAIREAGEQGISTGRTYQLDMPDGPMWFELSVTAKADRPEGPRVTILVRDITDRTRAMDAMARTSERLRLAADAAAFGIWEFNVISNELEWDEWMFRLYGIRREDFSGAYQAWQAGLHPDDRERCVAEVDQALRGEKVFDTEFRIVRPYGDVRHIKANGTVIRDPQGVPQRMIGVNYDITERKEAEESLRRSEESLRESQWIANMGSWEYDLIRNQVTWSESCYLLYGFSVGEVQPSFELFKGMVHPEDLHIIDETYDATIRDKTPSTTEFRIVLADGTVKWVQNNIIPIVAEQQLVGLKGSQIDITERKRNEAALQRSLTEKEILLKEIHHRVKNNLQVVTSLLDLQGEQLRDPAIAAIFGESRDRIRVMAMVHERLYQTGDLARIDLGEYIEGLVRYLAGIYGRDDLPVALTCEAEQEALGVDDSILCGLVVNELVSNAYKHAFQDGGPPAPAIRVEARREGGDLVLRIEDNGRGIPAGVKVDQSQTLGLKLVHLLSRQLRGSLTVGPGPGARFTLRFTPRPVNPGGAA